MKLRKLLLIITFMVFSTGNIFAQNEMKARIVYEDAETAFQNQEYEKTITLLTEAEKLLGKWSAKIGYLKIVSLDKFVNYEEWNDKADELDRQVQAYLKHTEKMSSDQIDMDIMREINTIDENLAFGKKIIAWEKMPEYLNAKKAEKDRKEDDAYNWYLKAYEKGNILATVEIGYYYFRKYDYSTAIEWFQKGIDKKYGRAYRALGLRYENGQGVPRNVEKALEYFLLAFEKGDPYAAKEISNYYWYNKKDTASAIKWLKNGSNKGIVDDMITLGYIYRTGSYGAEINFDEAIKWLNLAIKTNIKKTNAFYEIGLVYHKGLKDLRAAINWYKKGVDLKNWYCSEELGNIYFNLKEYQNAIDAYKITTDGDYYGDYSVSAMYNTGVAYFHLGKFSEAMQCFKKVQTDGLALLYSQKSAAMIAQMYEEGLGTQKDYVEAMNWYKTSYNIKGEEIDKALKNKVKEKIATMYEQGLGVEKDKKMAKEWRSK